MKFYEIETKVFFFDEKCLHNVWCAPRQVDN